MVSEKSGVTPLLNPTRINVRSGKNSTGVMTRARSTEKSMCRSVSKGFVQSVLQESFGHESTTSCDLMKSKIFKLTSSVNLTMFLGTSVITARTPHRIHSNISFRSLTVHTVICLPALAHSSRNCFPSPEKRAGK